MEIDEQSIAQVVVVGKQIAMVFKGDTTVYNAGAFKTLADDRFEELLKQLPGVEIKDNKILAGGEEVKRVLIDGKNFFGNKSQYALTDLEASDVKSVRVYEELSPEAKRQGNTTARKEKVMDVETKSKRSVHQGGNLEGSIGASLEKDYSLDVAKSAIRRPGPTTATAKKATGARSLQPERRQLPGGECFVQFEAHADEADRCPGGIHLPPRRLDHGLDHGRFPAPPSKQRSPAR